MDNLALPAPPRSENDRDRELVRRLVSTLFKGKWLIAACFIAVVTPVVVVTLLKVPQYQVASKVLLKASRAQVALSPGGPERIINSPINSQVLNSEVQILTSLDLIKSAVEKSGYRLPADDPTGPVLARQLDVLRGRIEVDDLPDSNVIRVSLVDPNPPDAARLLNTLVALYLDKHVTVHGSGIDAPAFFERQVAVAAAAVEKTRSRLERLERQDRIVDLEQEVSQNLHQLANLQATLKNIEADINAVDKEARSLEGQLRGEPEEVTAQKVMTINPHVTALRTKLAELQLQRTQLLQHYWPHSRFVQDKDAEIAALRSELAAAPPYVVGDTVTTPNRTKETLKQELVEKRATHAALVAKREALLGATGPYQARLAVLTDGRHELERLRKEFEEARNMSSLYTKKAEEARVSHAMDEEGILNVGVIQEASPSVPPLGRGLVRAGLLGALSGLALGVALAFATEFFNSTVKNEDDVERFLQLPVLAAIRRF